MTAEKPSVNGTATLAARSSHALTATRRPTPAPATEGETTDTPANLRPRASGAPRLREPDAQRRSLTITLPSLRLPRPRLATGSRPGRKRVVVWAVTLLIAAALTVTDLVLAHRADARSDLAAARSAAAASARTRVPAILSYSYKTLSHDLAAAQTNTTGTFHSDYQKLLSTIVAPSAKSKRIINKATVTGVGVVSGNQQHVVVLVFVTQTTTSAGGGTPLVSGSRVNVTMTKTHGKWLVSALNPV